MGKLVLLSDREVEPWQADVVDLLEQLSGYKVRGLAVVVLVEPEEENGEDILAFYNRMSIRDKQLAASVIEGDVHYAIAQDAIRHYMGEDDEEDDYAPGE